MSNEVALSGIAVALYYIALRNKKNATNKTPPRWWTRELFKDRNNHGHDLLDTLRLEDGMGFRNFVRMNPVDFECLLTMVGPSISKTKTNFRDPVSTINRLAVTLRFLASGDSYTSLMYTFKISKQIISEFVPEVCTAINIALRTYIKVSSFFIIWRRYMVIYCSICNEISKMVFLDNYLFLKLHLKERNIMYRQSH